MTNQSFSFIVHLHDLSQSFMVPACACWFECDKNGTQSKFKEMCLLQKRYGIEKHCFVNNDRMYVLLGICFFVESIMFHWWSESNLVKKPSFSSYWETIIGKLRIEGFNKFTKFWPFLKIKVKIKICNL